MRKRKLLIVSILIISYMLSIFVLQPGTRSFALEQTGSDENPTGSDTGEISGNSGDGTLSSESGEPESSGSASSTESQINIQIQYDPYDDGIYVISDKKDAEFWCADVKNSTGTSLKGTAFIKGTASKKYKNDLYYGYICLNEKGNGSLHIAENKNAYLYVTASEPKADKTSYKPNVVIEASPYKKIDVVLDYSSAVKETEYSCAVNSIKYTKQDNTKGSCSEKDNPELFRDILSRLEFGTYIVEDGEKEYNWESTVYTDEDYFDAYRCTEPPAGYRVVVNSCIAPGKFEYKKQDDDTYDWIYLFDESWGDKRLLNYRMEYDTEKYELDHYYKDQTGISSDSEQYWDNPIVDWTVPDHSACAVSYVPGENKNDVLYNDTEFTYMLADGKNISKSGFYRENGSDNENRYLSINEYGIQVSVKDKQTPESGDKLSVKVSVAKNASDFGVNVLKVSSKAEAKEGDSFILEGVPGYSFNGIYLSEVLEEISYIEKGDKIKISMAFRLLGEPATDDKKAYRTGKPKTVSIAKQSKPATAKIDVKKEILSIKNGYDYQVSWTEKITDTEGKEQVIQHSSGWKTILPYSKDGKALEAIVYTEDYTPAKKVSDDPYAFTSEKISGIAVDELLELGDCEVTVRKSATVSKPVSLPDEDGKDTVIIESRKAAPVLSVKENGRYAAADSKGTLNLPSISKGEGDTASGKVTYEYAIISKEDYESELTEPGTIDFSSVKWTKYVSKKKITLNKTNTKYKLSSENSITARILKEDSYILIRRAGYADKSGTFMLASNFAVTKLAKNTEGESEIIEWIPVEQKTLENSEE